MMHGGMTIAVLCPGPSLRGFLAQPAAADCFIGVNHAAEDWPCHYWAVNDAEAMVAYNPMARAVKGGGRELPTAFTSQQAFVRQKDSLTKKGCPAALLHESIPTHCPSDRQWNRFTMTAALVLAEYIGAAVIRLYGCDQQGGDYFKPGIYPTAEVCAGRWASEKAVYSRVLGWLKDKKVHVERCFVD